MLLKIEPGIRMGRSYWFECSRCGYRAKVAGGADRGLHFHVQTVSCRECKELFDAVTRLRVPDDSALASKGPGLNWRRSSFINQHRRSNAPPDFQSVLNRLPYKGIRHFKWLNYKIRCPVSHLHRTESWNSPGKCPRCGLFLERTALPYRIWE